VKMDARNSSSQSHVLLLTGTSISWAAVPFLLHDLSMEAAVAVSVILLVASVAAYLFVRKLCQEV
jgi:putative flippase GtrA